MENSELHEKREESNSIIRERIVKLEVMVNQVTIGIEKLESLVDRINQDEVTIRDRIHTSFGELALTIHKLSESVVALKNDIRTHGTTNETLDIRVSKLEKAHEKFITIALTVSFVFAVVWNIGKEFIAKFTN